MIQRINLIFLHILKSIIIETPPRILEEVFQIFHLKWLQELRGMLMEIIHLNITQL